MGTFRQVVHRGETEEARGGRRDAPGLCADQRDAQKQATWPRGAQTWQRKMDHLSSISDLPVGDGLRLLSKGF